MSDPAVPESNSQALSEAELGKAFDDASREVNRCDSRDTNIGEIPGLAEPMEALRNVFGDKWRPHVPTAESNSSEEAVEVSVGEDEAHEELDYHVAAPVKVSAEERKRRATKLLLEYRDWKLFDGSREDDLEAAQSLLRRAMPLDSMIVDLWDWDIHFGGDLSEDWLRAAALGDEDSIGWCTDALAELFIQKCDEYDMDYDQHSDPEGFKAQVHEYAEAFIGHWRVRLLAAYPALHQEQPK